MNKFSVVIPFRDRHEHLSVLVPHLRNYATENGLEFEIIVAEQNDTLPLRRGALRNEGVRISTGNIIVLHDVDYLPDSKTKYWSEEADVYRAVNQVEFIAMDGSTREETDVPTGYRHFKKSVDSNFFGGVLCITKKSFLQINGYNPLFEGWGLEDDEFRERIKSNNLQVVSGGGLFRALPHPDSFRNDALFRKNQILFANRESLKTVGINHGSLQLNINKEKSSAYDVDVWLEVTGWRIPINNLTTDTSMWQDVKQYDLRTFDRDKNIIELTRPIILLNVPESQPQILHFLVEVNYNVYEVSDNGKYLCIPFEKDV